MAHPLRSRLQTQSEIQNLKSKIPDFVYIFIHSRHQDDMQIGFAVTVCLVYASLYRRLTVWEPFEMTSRASALTALLAITLALPHCLWASQTQEIPLALKPAEKVHVDIYKKFALAVVGLTCMPRQKNPMLMAQGYYGTGAVI